MRLTIASRVSFMGLSLAHAYPYLVLYSMRAARVYTRCMYTVNGGMFLCAYIAIRNASIYPPVASCSTNADATKLFLPACMYTHHEASNTLSILIEIPHAASQTRLQHLGPLLKQPHDHAPAPRRENRPRAFPHLRLERFPRLHVLHARHRLQQRVDGVPQRGRARAWPIPRLAGNRGAGGRGGEEGEFRKGEHDPREDVDDDLLVHGVGGCGGAPEDVVA